MSHGIEAIGAAAAALGDLTKAAASTAHAAGPLARAASATEQPVPFSDLMTDAVHQVQTLEDQAHQTVAGLMSGNGVDVHQAMIASEKASMSFELALAVRNKAVQAYQSVIGMQF